MNYFKIINSIWKRFESNTDLSPAHRALFWAIFHRWNQNFLKPFEANRFDLMKLSGIKSDKTYFILVGELDAAEFVKFEKGSNGKSKSTLEVTYVNSTEVETTYVNPTYVETTEVEQSTYVNSTEVEQVYLGKNYVALYNDKDILSSDTTDSKKTTDSIKEENIYLEENTREEKILKIQEHPERLSPRLQKIKNEKKQKDCTFLESDIGTIETFSEYVSQSEFPDADIKFWFGSMKDWIDKKIGQPPKRANWKLVFNTFIRNSINKHGDYKKSNQNGNIGNSKIAGNSTNVQKELSDIDSAVERFVGRRNS